MPRARDEPGLGLDRWEPEPLDTSFYLHQKGMLGAGESWAQEEDEFTGVDDVELLAGFQEVICIPPAGLTYEERKMWSRVLAAMLLGRPPASPGEALIRRTRQALVERGLGQKVTVATLFRGINLALARIGGIAVRTPLRGVARDLGVRYSTLLAVRKAALTEIERLGPERWVARG